MREIKLWDKEGNLDGFAKRIKDEGRCMFIRDYSTYIENFYEEYYCYSGIEGYTHDHIEYIDII